MPDYWCTHDDCLQNITAFNRFDTLDELDEHDAANHIAFHSIELSLTEDRPWMSDRVVTLAVRETRARADRCLKYVNPLPIIDGTHP
jgi:hypothetical protein